MKSYRKYRWFYTTSGKLVVGGKSAIQNDELLTKMKKAKGEKYVMHTSHPGSPFSIIVSEMGKVTKKDKSECAIFTGCFSRAWRRGLRKTEVDIFKLSQLNKLPRMKVGTWGVLGRIKKMKITLELFVEKQKKVYRAVPFSGGLKICPGKVDKTKMILKLREALSDEKVSRDELLSALPPGGVRIC